VTILDAIILGLVEGITEYLPVSSTGHLIIASWLLGLLDDPARKPAIDSFNVIIQGGAILAVIGLYWPRCRMMLRGLVGRDANGLGLFVKLVVAFMPAAVLGVLFDDWIEERLFAPIPVLMALGGGGLLLLILSPWIKTLVKRENGERDDFAQLTVLHAFAIGCMQVIAMWPGTSRSMMTILGGILFGLSPRRAAEFSFLLGLPTLGGACVYKLAKAGRDDPAAFIASLGGPIPPAVGIVVAAFSAALAIKWLVGYLSKGGMAAFGWWRVAVAAAFGVAVFVFGLEL